MHCCRRAFAGAQGDKVVLAEEPFSAQDYMLKCRRMNINLNASNSMHSSQWSVVYIYTGSLYDARDAVNLHSKLCHLLKA